MLERINKLMDFFAPLVLCVLSLMLGWCIHELQDRLEHSNASNLCFSKGHIDAYLSKLEDGEFVCFREDLNKKRITKSALVIDKE
jgi:hypothetical protein